MFVCVKVKGQLKKTGSIGLKGFTTVGPTHNGVDLGVSWANLSFGIIKAGIVLLPRL